VSDDLEALEQIAEQRDMRQNVGQRKDCRGQRRGMAVVLKNNQVHRMLSRAGKSRKPVTLWRPRPDREDE
jgi:hypothetical protein